MSLLRIVVVPLLKVILPGQILLRFSAAFKASCFSKFLVALFGEFHTTVPLCEKLFLPNSVFVRFTSSNTPLRFDSVKLKNGSNLWLKPCLTLKTSIESLRLYKYPRSCHLI